MSFQPLPRLPLRAILKEVRLTVMRAYMCFTRSWARRASIWTLPSHLCSARGVAGGGGRGKGGHGRRGGGRSGGGGGVRSQEEGLTSAPERFPALCVPHPSAEQARRCQGPRVQTHTWLFPLLFCSHTNREAWTSEPDVLNRERPTSRLRRPG